MSHSLFSHHRYRESRFSRLLSNINYFL